MFFDVFRTVDLLGKLLTLQYEDTDDDIDLDGVEEEIMDVNIG